MAAKLELSFPDWFGELFDDLDPNAVDPEWALSPVAGWERLRDTVEELFKQRWKGVPAVVIGEDQAGNFVCLVQEGEAVGAEVHLLNAETLGLEVIAEDVRVWLSSIVGESADPLEAEEEPGADADADSATLDADLLSALLGKGPAPDEPEASPQLKQGVLVVLAALEDGEHVELVEDRRAMLVSELCAVVGEARSPKDFVKRFVRTLVHSDNLEEVYGTDDRLREVVKLAMDE